MRLSIYTDGGCSGNPGPGGWAYVITGESPGRETGAHAILAEKWGAEADTTNNRMELNAVIAALQSLPLPGGQVPEGITVYTDSQYVQRGITLWIHGWKRNNWLTTGKQPVKNKDLWQRLDELSGKFPITWAWVKGHAGNPLNERCDRMTRQAIASLGGGGKI
jgi:ribonuclease HI